MALDSETPSEEPHLERMDRELKVELLQWPLYVLDEVIVAPSARSSQLIRASGLRFNAIWFAGFAGNTRMPIYEYICDECSQRYERIVKNESAAVRCPKCASAKHTIQLSVFARPSGGGKSSGGTSSGFTGGGGCCGGGCGCH
jgi:putative FmdB family regulatory protein